MNFVLSKAGSRLMQTEADARASMSAARAIVEVCNVAQSHDMPMPSNVLDGLVQLIQQTTDFDVRHFIAITLCLTTRNCVSCLKQESADCHVKHHTILQTDGTFHCMRSHSASAWTEWFLYEMLL